jgi:3-methylcrotonyl-CoA carboxylase alpha subunit
VFGLNPFYSTARIDTGVEQGAEISPFYDPMIAKVIGRGESRDEAAEEVIGELLNCAIWPVRTNAGFIVRLLRHDLFRSGDVDTGLIGRELDELTRPEPASEGVLNAALEVLSMPDSGGAFTAYDLVHQQSHHSGPWSHWTGFRLNRTPALEARLADQDGNTLSFGRGDGIDPALVTRCGEWAIVPELGCTHAFQLYAVRGLSGGATGDGAITSPMPGRIIAVEVAAGAPVTKGQKLVTLEAMKMEHTLTAPFDGVVAELNATPGAQVSEGTLLVRVEAADS